jgi:hypothetical protein
LRYAISRLFGLLLDAVMWVLLKLSHQIIIELWLILFDCNHVAVLSKLRQPIHTNFGSKISSNLGKENFINFGGYKCIDQIVHEIV